uniref:Uncharacterized protein n=1 Tax=Oryza punctata TaxID=4537 RepID=A0A0E0L202_ORYPU
MHLVIVAKKEHIKWFLLLLGQTHGFCALIISTCSWDNVLLSSWLKLSLGPMIYDDAADVDSNTSFAPMNMSSKKGTPVVSVLQHAMVSRSYIPNAEDAVVTPCFVASMIGLLVDHHGNDGVAFVAARVLFTGDASGSITSDAVLVASCFNFLGP